MNGPIDLPIQQWHSGLCTLFNKVVPQWVPEHADIAKNAIAGRLPKAAEVLPHPNISISAKEVKILLKQKKKSVWRLRNNGYDLQKDQISTLDKRTQTTIFYWSFWAKKTSE